jgi:uncharacterized protein YbjT (DUF2867 family)
VTRSSILLVGATGKFGLRLVRQLAAAGVKPRAFVRSREKGEAIASLATPVLGDLKAPETLAEPFRGAERVFILAPPTPEMESLERNAIDAAVAAGAKRIVYLSNFAATEGDEDLYAHVHGLHQRLLATLGVDWTVLRPTGFMTSVPFVWRSVLNQGLLREAGGSGAMSFIDPDDEAALQRGWQHWRRRDSPPARLRQASFSIDLSRLVGMSAPIATKRALSHHFNFCSMSYKID